MKKASLSIAIAIILNIILAAATTPCGQTFTTASLTTTLVTAPVAAVLTETSPAETVTDVSGTITILSDFTSGAAASPACSSTGEDVVIREQRDDTEDVEGIIRLQDYVAVITTAPPVGVGTKDDITIRCKDPTDFSTVNNDVAVVVSPTEITDAKIATGTQAGTNVVLVALHLFNGNFLVLQYNCDDDTLDQLRLGGFTFFGSANGIIKNGAGIYAAASESSSGDLMVMHFDGSLGGITDAKRYSLATSIISSQIAEGDATNDILVAGFVSGASDLLLTSWDSSLSFNGDLQIDDTAGDVPNEIVYDTTTQVGVIATDETIVSFDGSSVIGAGSSLNGFETLTNGGAFADEYLENSNLLVGGLSLNFLGAMGTYDLISGTGLSLNDFVEDPDNSILRVIRDANGEPWGIGFSITNLDDVEISHMDNTLAGLTVTNGDMPFDFRDIALALARDNTGIYAAYSYSDPADFDPTDTYAIEISAPGPGPVPEFSTITLLLAALVALGGIFAMRKIR